MLEGKLAIVVVVAFIGGMKEVVGEDYLDGSQRSIKARFFCSSKEPNGCKLNSLAVFWIHYVLTPVLFTPPSYELKFVK